MPMIKVLSEVAGQIWKVESTVGQLVNRGDPILIVESMKMEIPLDAPQPGVVREIYVADGETVGEGQVVAVIETYAAG